MTISSVYALIRTVCCAIVFAIIASLALAQTNGNEQKIQTIDFESQSGSQLFSNANPPLHILSATFSGGQILTNATYLPVDPTTVYGTASFCVGCLSDITIQFSSPVSNFSVFIMNGEPFIVSYIIAGNNQNDTQTITLPPNYSLGAQTVNINDNNIQSVTIQPVAVTNEWDFLIDNVIFTPSSPILIDPIQSSILSGDSVTSDPNVLASANDIVQGVAADGVTEAVLQIPAGTAGEKFQVTVLDDQGSASSSIGNDGGLIAIGANIDSASSSVEVTAEDTIKGPMAFAIYLAPKTFVRKSQDESASSRGVSLQVMAEDTSAISNTDVKIVRPPVMLVHGLWDTGATTWQGFSALTTDPRFQTSTLSYASPVAGITASVPSYSSERLNNVLQNSLGLAYNAPFVFNQIRANTANFRKALSVAAVQADVVAHSMGGDISRTMALANIIANFYSADTFGKGPVHKLITIDTPHLGTPLATRLLEDSESCIRNLLAYSGKLVLQSVTTASGTINGAVGDLQGDGYGGSMSMALTNLPSVSHFPTAYIAGTEDANNLAGLDCFFCNAAILRRCSGTLAKQLTPNNWPQVFGQDNDAIVPLISELNNTTLTSSAMQPSGVIHSQGTHALGFNLPSALDQTTNTPTQVIKLLNEPVNGTDFHQPN